MKIENSTNHISTFSYIFPDQRDQITYFQSQTPFFKWCLANAKDLSEDQLRVLGQVLHAMGGNGGSYKQTLEAKLSESQREYYLQSMTHVTPKMLSYVYLKDMGFAVTEDELICVSPLLFIQQMQLKYRWDIRGISQNDKGTHFVEANTFAEYLLVRIPLVQLTDGTMYHYNGEGLYNRLDDNMLKTICRLVLNEAGPTIWRRGLETEYIAALKHVAPFIQEFDGNPDIINFKNGLLDMKTLSMSPHNKGHYSIKQLAYSYDPDADCPAFKAFLADVFEGDQERVELIKELLGYLWVKQVKIQKGFIFLGRGSNGKSVLAKIIRRLVGKNNLSSTPLEKFQNKFGLQELPGKLVNISSENEFSGDFGTENFKQVTSGDALTIELKYQHAYTDVLYAKLVIILNRMMDSKDRTNAYYRRLQIIPFNRKYEELKQGEQPIDGLNYMDLNLESELLVELPGIFNFAMEGLQQLMKNDFKMTPSEVAEAALQKYKREQNPMIRFVDDRLVFEEGATIFRPSISTMYKEWFRDNGEGSYRSIKESSILEELRIQFSENGWDVPVCKVQGKFYFKNVRAIDQTNSDSTYVSPVI